jgi:hypothetical protein
VNVSDVTRALAQATAILAQVTPKMLNEVRMGAGREQSQHAYKNRTGRLEKSTRGILIRSTAKESRVTLEMGMDYASYVERKGLTSLAEEARITEAILTEHFLNMFAQIL